LRKKRDRIATGCQAFDFVAGFVRIWTRYIFTDRREQGLRFLPVVILPERGQHFLNLSCVILPGWHSFHGILNAFCNDQGVERVLKDPSQSPIPAGVNHIPR
jgi:hypothetical protein